MFRAVWKLSLEMLCVASDCIKSNWITVDSNSNGTNNTFEKMNKHNSSSSSVRAHQQQKQIGAFDVQALQLSLCT